MNTFLLTVSTPSGKAFEAEAYRLTVKGCDGELGIMAGHIPFATTVVGGKCNITLPDESVIHAEISEGLLTVSKDKTHLLVSEYNSN